METKKKSNHVRLIVITILLTLIVIISAQNLRSVKLDVLFWTLNLPLVALLAVNTVTVAIITFLLSRWKRR